jgi:Uma2 family endonuclease
MTPTTETPPPKPRPADPDGRVLLYDVPWEMYARLVKTFEGKRNVRLTYDRGSLEIMAPSFEHDDDGDFLADLAKILIEEFGLPIRRGGSMTLKRKRWKKGLGPDRCFWIANAAKLEGVRQLDLRIHPPPDLAIEIDVTNPSLDRFGIYAKLGVPELWRLDGDELKFHRLDGKKYAEAATSQAFPGISPGDLLPFLRQARGAADQGPATRDFRAWVRARPR